MRRRIQTLVATVVIVVAAAATPARSEGPVTFTAEVFATPSYHLMEIPKVEEGGEGFTWSYLNHQPESWGRALLFWPGPTAEATFGTSVPQTGPLEGHRWKSPGAWASYPTGGEARGAADFGDPPIPLGTTVETPGGTLEVLSFTGRAGENEGAAESTFGSFRSSLAPVTMGYGAAASSATRDETGAVSSGWAVARHVEMGTVTIDEIRSDASVRATADGETGTWKLTISGVTVNDQRLEWTNDGVSIAPGSEDALEKLNAELAKGAEGLRSEFQLVPGKVWRDEAGTHVRSGFLQMGHRPAVLENNPGQKLTYALSVVSARALYRQEAGADLDEELTGSAPDVPGPTGTAPDAPPRTDAAATGPAPVPTEIGEASTLTAPEPEALLAPVQDALDAGDLGARDSETAPVTGPPAVDGEVALAAPGAYGGGAGTLLTPAGVSGLGQKAADSLRGGFALVALIGAAAAVAVLRAARRQLTIATTRGGS